MPYPFGASKVQAMLDRLGVPIVVSGVTVNGTVASEDVEHELEDRSPGPVRELRVTVRTGALPALAVGVAITVDGVSCKVTALRQVAAGALTVAYCAPA